MFGLIQSVATPRMALSWSMTFVIGNPSSMWMSGSMRSIASWHLINTECNIICFNSIASSCVAPEGLLMSLDAIVSSHPTLGDPRLREWEYLQDPYWKQMRHDCRKAGLNRGGQEESRGASLLAARADRSFFSRYPSKRFKMIRGLLGWLSTYCIWLFKEHEIDKHL